MRAGTRRGDNDGVRLSGDPAGYNLAPTRWFLTWSVMTAQTFDASRADTDVVERAARRPLTTETKAAFQDD